MNFEGFLAASEGLARQRVDLLYERVRHGVAASGLAIAVHHQPLPGTLPGAVIGIGIAEVECQVEFRVRIQLLFGDPVEALRRLAIAKGLLGTDFAGPIADRIRLEVIEAAVVSRLPYFKFGIFLEDAYEDRCAPLHALAAEQHHGVLAEWLFGGGDQRRATATSHSNCRSDGCHSGAKTGSKHRA